MAEEEARRACLAAGATRDSVRQRGAVVERSETPLPYMAPEILQATGEKNRHLQD